MRKKDVDQEEVWRHTAEDARMSFSPNASIEVTVEDSETVGSRVVARKQRVEVYDSTPRYALALYMKDLELMPSDVARALGITVTQVLDLLRGVQQFDYDKVETALHEYLRLLKENDK